MIKVLYILDPATVGGATKAFLTLMHELLSRQVVPIVCMPNEGELAAQLREENIVVIITHHQEMITSIDKGNGWKSVKRNIKKFLKYIRQDITAIRTIQHEVNLRTIDIIHTNSSRSDVGFFLNCIWHKPHIVHLREFGDYDYDVHPLNPLWRFIYNTCSDKFLCVSNAVLNHWASKGLKANKLTLVYDGIDERKISQSHINDRNDSFLRIVMSGGIIDTKGQHIAVEALTYIPKQIRENIHIDFIGWFYDVNYKENIENFAKAKNISSNISFLGSRENILSLLGDYQIGLMCSRSEGFGLVTAEYMFASLGVIVSDAGANPELIQHEKTGLVFESRNPRALAEAIMRYYTNRSMLCAHAIAAREDALMRFTAVKNADAIHKVYEYYLKRK